MAQRETYGSGESDPNEARYGCTATAKIGPNDVLSVRSFYGCPAYHAMAEVGVTSHPQDSAAASPADCSIRTARGARTGVRTLLALVLATTPSVDLFTHKGFTPWGRLPGVAELDDVERDLVILGRRMP
jgi:phosphinothricin acetyltransferase